MTPEQNARLLSDYRVDPSLRNRNRVVEANLGLVEKAADRFSKLSRIPFDDLYSVGCVGLIKAVARFDLARGNRFSSYAMTIIRSEMLHERRDTEDLILAPRKLVDDYNQLQRAYKKMTALGVQVTYPEVAESMGIDLQAVTHCREVTHCYVAIDASADDESPVIELAAPENADDQIWLHAAIKTLPRVQREILIRHYLASESPAAIALSLNIALPTVQQWLAESITELQRHAGIEPAAVLTQPQRPAEINFARGRNRDGRAHVHGSRAIAARDSRFAAVS
jgi:RNA polymerase sigma factor (sigma-70 family)